MRASIRNKKTLGGFPRGYIVLAPFQTSFFRPQYNISGALTLLLHKRETNAIYNAPAELQLIDFGAVNASIPT